MPIYEYRCNHCQETSSVFVRRIGAAFEHSCPSCGSSLTHRGAHLPAMVTSPRHRLPGAGSERYLMGMG